MNRYSGGNSVLNVGAFMAPLLPLTLMSAFYSDVMNYRCPPHETALLWLVGLLVSYALIILHESGHLLAARLVGIEIESVTIGHWRRLVSFNAGALKVTLRAAPASGYVMQKPVLRHIAMPAMVFFLLGGVIAEGLVIVFAAQTPAPERISTFSDLLFVFVRTDIVWVGAYQVIFNLYPSHGWVGGEKLPNDGLLLLQLWKKRHCRSAEDQLVRDLQKIVDLGQEGKYTAAIEKAEELAASRPENFDLLKYVGSLHSMHGDNARAEAIYRQLLKQPLGSPNKFAEILDLLACIPLYSGRMDLLSEADGWTNEALRYVPNAITLKGTRGSVLIELGKLDEGIAILNEVVKRSECSIDHAIGSAYLAKAHAAKGNVAEARRLIDKATTLGSEEVVVKRIAQELSHLGATTPAR